MSAVCWQESDVGTLLAWLDYCIANNLDFWTAIITRLEESRSLHTGHEFSFTRLQIRNKLVGIPREAKLSRSTLRPYLKLATIMAEGSSCLPDLAEHIVFRVRAEFDRFVEFFKQPEHALDLLGLSKSSESKGSQAVATNKNSATPPDVGTERAVALLNACRQSEQCSLLASLPHDKSHDSTHPLTLHNSAGSNRRMGLPQSQQVNDATRLGAIEEKNRRLEAEAQSLSERNRRLEELARNLAEQNQRLEKNAQTLAEDIDLHKIARRAREDASQELGESDFYMLYRQSWDMQRRLSNMETALGFHERLIPAWEDTLSYLEIDKKMDTILDELHSIALGLRSTALQQKISITDGGVLELLVDSSFRVSPDSRTAKELWLEWVSSSDSVTIVQTLALAAVRDWVLNIKFPVLHDGSMISEMFKSWRSVFLDCAGPLMAQNLEATAYSHFIDSSLFKDHIVPQHATSLSEKFLGALASILSPVLDDDASEFIRDRLTAAFTEACRFKASTVLMNTRRYQLLIFPTGLQEPANRRVSQTGQTTGLAKSFIQAQLNIYQTIFFNQIHRQSNVLLDTDNFFIADEAYSTRPCLHSKDIITQAIENGHLAVAYPSPESASQINVGCATEAGCKPASLQCSMSKERNLGAVAAIPGLNTQELDDPAASDFFCTLCKCGFARAYNLERHKAGQKHRTLLAKQCSTPTRTQPSAKKGSAKHNSSNRNGQIRKNLQAKGHTTGQRFRSDPHMHDAISDFNLRTALIRSEQRIPCRQDPFRSVLSR